VKAVVEIVRSEELVAPAFSGIEGTLKVVPGTWLTAGVTVAERETLPVKPKLSTVIVEIPAVPASKLAGFGLEAERAKSEPTFTVTIPVCVTLPLVAVIVRV